MIPKQKSFLLPSAAVFELFGKNKNCVDSEIRIDTEITIRQIPDRYPPLFLKSKC